MEIGQTAKSYNVIHNANDCHWQAGNLCIDALKSTCGTAVERAEDAGEPAYVTWFKDLLEKYDSVAKSMSYVASRCLADDIGGHGVNPIRTGVCADIAEYLKQVSPRGSFGFFSPFYDNYGGDDIFAYRCANGGADSLLDMASSFEAALLVGDILYYATGAFLFV